MNTPKFYAKQNISFYKIFPGLFGETREISIEAYIRMLLESIEAETGIGKDNIKKKSRRREHVEARQIFYSLMKNKFKHRVSLKFLGEMMGYDHATVVYSIRKVNDLCSIDVIFRNKYNAISMALNKKINELYY